MLKKVSISIIFIGGFFLCSYAQCLDRDSLRNRLYILRGAKSSNIKNSEKLNVLLEYESQINKCPYRLDSVHAYLLQCIGMIYYRSADFLHAAEYVSKSVKFVDENKGSKTFSPKFNIDNYYYLSVIYDSLSNFPEMLKAIDKCNDLGWQYSASENVSYLRTLYRKLEYFYDMGDFYTAITSAQNCEKTGWEYAKSDSIRTYQRGEDFASSSLGWRILSLIKTSQFNEATKLLENKLQGFESKKTLNYVAFIYGLNAEVQLSKRNYSKALANYNLQLKNYEDAGDKEFYCKQTLNNIGHDVFFIGYRDMNKAITCYKKALLCINKNGRLHKEDSIESLSLYSNIAEAYTHKKLFDSALSYFQMAFDQVKKGSNEFDFLNIPVQGFQNVKKIHYLVNLLIAKGDAYRMQYQVKRDAVYLRTALSIYYQADQFLNRIKPLHLDLNSRLFWRSYARRLYENAIAASYEANDLDRAFYFFERSRAVLLTDQLNMQTWLGEKGILKLAQLTKDIQTLANEIDTTSPSSENYQRLQDKKYRLSRNLEQFQESIKTENPLYYQSFLDTSIIRIADVQRAILNEQEALFEIYTGDSAVYIFIITKSQAFLRRLNKPNFENTLDEYLEFLANKEKLNGQFNAFMDKSMQLYKMIMGDLKIPPGRIIVSPDAQYFPFEALVTGINNEEPVYFLEKHPVSYTYSAKYLMTNFVNRSHQSARPFIGYAPGNFSSSMSLRALQGGDLSLNRIQTFFPNSEVFTGKEASRNNFMQQFYKYEIIQLYTHAADSSAMHEPVIWFADSALYLSELIGEHKPVTRLIVLSACQTGTGKLNQGEGVFSFNRGFAAFGIPAAITNLWSVDDEATYDIMELFHKFLSDGFPTDIALQKAKLDYLKLKKKNRLPYYWAAPVLVGKAEIIELSKPLSWVWVLLGICILFLIVWAKQMHSSGRFRKSNYLLLFPGHSAS